MKNILITILITVFFAIPQFSKGQSQAEQAIDESKSLEDYNNSNSKRQRQREEEKTRDNNPSQEDEFKVIPEIMFGFGFMMPGSMQTSFPEEKSDPLGYGHWNIEEKQKMSVTIGFRLNFFFNKNFNMLMGADFLYFKSGYSIYNTNYANSDYSFQQSSLFIPLELHLGEGFMFTLGGFVNLILTNPSWTDVSGDDENSYAETGEIDTKYYHTASYGVSIGFRINFSKEFSCYFQYRYGITPWLETPFEKAYLRNLAMGVSISFN